MRIRFLLTGLILLSSINFALSQGDESLPPLPRGLAPYEVNLPLPHSDDPTPPPAEPVMVLTEWEEAQGIFIRWDQWYGVLQSQIIDHVVDVTRAYVVVGSQSIANQCFSYLQGQGVSPLDSVVFLIVSTNSIWIRDYAPWWLWRLESWDLAMYEWDYNRPRPQDDVFPEWISTNWGIPYYGMDLTHTGGNWLLDDWNQAFCSELILVENWGLTPQGVNELFYRYCNLDTVPLCPTFYGIDHANMYAKLINDHTVFVNQFPAGSQYTWAMNAVAEMFSNMTNRYGESFDVIRINTPNWGGTPYTYCNTLICNNIVLVPTYNNTYDDDALALFREHMPGYEVFGINANSTIGLSGAINCITHNVPHPSLIRIMHARMHDTLNTTNPYTVSAEIITLGTLNEDELKVHWRSSGSPAWHVVSMVNTVADSFVCEIPPCPGGYVDYYIYAEAEAGNWTTSPRYGPEAYNRFHAGVYEISAAITPESPPIVIPAGGGSFDFTVEIEATGAYPVEFDGWIDCDLPNGRTYTAIIREDLRLEAGASLVRELTQAVPGQAPTGDYTYTLKVGGYPDSVYAESSFEFEKSAVEGAEYIINWNLSERERYTGVSDASALQPVQFTLSASPNPFNPSTKIRFCLSEAGMMNLSVYDISGREVVELINGGMQAGHHEAVFDASNLSSGIYFARLKIGEVIKTQKLLLLK